jgi:dynactin 1
MQLDQKYLPEKQLHDAAIQACNKVYGPGNEGFASVRNSITLSFPFIAQINTRLQEGFYHEKSNQVETEAAVSRRAAQQQSQTPEELQVHMEDRDTVIKEIRQALRLKSDEAEQQKLRAEMVESRAERVNLEADEKCRKMKSELDNQKQEIENQQKDYEATLDAYRKDITILKAEKTQLVSQRAKMMNKSNVMERLGVSSSSKLSPGITSATAMVQDSPLLCEQIKSLTQSIDYLQKKLIESEGRSMKKRISNLPPIPKLPTAIPELLDISKKIEENTAPILRPSQLIKVGQPQPAMLMLASKLHEKGKCIQRLPVLETELRKAIAASEGSLKTTPIGSTCTSKVFNQKWDGSGALVAEIWGSQQDHEPARTFENVFLNNEEDINFMQLLQPTLTCM